MNLLNRLKNAYNYAEMYKHRCSGGAVPAWSVYLKNKRLYKGETMHDYMVRMSGRYDGDIRNDKLLDKLELIQQNILKLIDKIVVGAPVSIASIHKPFETLENMPPPPPPPPPSKPRPKPTEAEIAQASSREKMMAELMEKLKKRGVTQASGGKRRRRKRY